MIGGVSPGALDLDSKRSLKVWKCQFDSTIHSNNGHMFLSLSKYSEILLEIRGFFKYRTVFNVSVKEFFDDVSFTSKNMIDLYEVVEKV